MSFTNNLIDFNVYANDFTDSDVDSPVNHLKINDSLEENGDWPDRQGNLDASPILDSNVWVGFNTDHGGVTKLVSSEEDLISDSDCNTPVHGDKNGDEKNNARNSLMSDDWENNFTSNLSNRHHNNQDMDSLADGFAFNEVITIGEYANDEDSGSSPGSHSKTMADRWSSNEYDTVLRINSTSDKKHQEKISENGTCQKTSSYNTTNKKKENSISMDENMCTSCNERVYITERLVIDHMLFHQQCFKCAKCRRILNMNNFAANSGKLFCKPHFLEIFRQTGKYDEIDFTTKEISNQPIENFGNQNESGNIIHENTQTDELPPPQITRNIVEKFRQLESASGIESLLPRQLSSGQQNMKSTNVRTDSIDFDNESTTEDVLDELPTPGITKNLLSLWSSMESKSLYSSDKSASSTCGTPRKTNKSTSQFHEIPFLSTDIVRHDDFVEDNYPAPNTAKSLAAKFKGDAPVMQSQSNCNINRSSSVSRTANIHYITPGVDIISSSTPNDDWLQCRLSGADQGSENTPIQRSDVFRSESLIETDELPEQGITRNLIGLFRSMEAK